MLRRVCGLLVIGACLISPRPARADITEVLNTPLAGSPTLGGLATAVFHGISENYPDTTAAILSETQGLSALPYYAFQNSNINARLTSSNEFYYYTTDAGGTTASFFQNDGAGQVLTDTTTIINSGADFVGYINFPVTGPYTIHIGYADDALAIFLNGDGTPGSGDYVATQNYWGLYSGQAGISDTCNVTVNTAGWYAFEMAYFQGCCGNGMDVQITGPATVQFGSDFNHWTAFVPAYTLNVTPQASYSGPPGLATAVWHESPVFGSDPTSIAPRNAWANSTSPNYVFLDPAADANFYGYQQFVNGDTGNYNVSDFVLAAGTTGLARDDTDNLDNTMMDFVGWMHVPITGTYYLGLLGDDTAALYFGGTGPIGSGTLWIDITFHGPTGYNPLISNIQAGWYPIEIVWNQGNGGYQLALTYSGPGKIHLAADFNRWTNSVGGLAPAPVTNPTATSFVSGFAASVYHLANNYETGATLDATLLPALISTMQMTTPNYRFFTGNAGNPNALYYRGNESQGTNAVLGSYAQGSAAADATAIGSTIIDHQGYVNFGQAGYQWIFFDAATDLGAVYLGGNGQPGTGQLLVSGSFNTQFGASSWGRVNIASPGWYPIEVLYLSRYDCGAACNANLVLSGWGPGSVTFAAAPVNNVTPPAPGGLLASVYRLSAPLPIASDTYTIAGVLAHIDALEPNYTFLDPQGAASFNLSGTDTTPLNTFLDVHASGLAAADANAVGPTIIDFRGAITFAQAGNYTINMTAADDAAALILGQQPNSPLGQLVLERNFNGTVTSVGALSSPITLQVTQPASHPFELVWYNSGSASSTQLAALGLSITGPGPVAFAAPLNAYEDVAVCGDFNARVSATTSTVDVANYGAVPDDGTDDYTSIQAAVAALGSNQTLLFHPGNYNIVYSDLGTIATVDGLTNVDIDGNGATLLISGYNPDVPATSGSFFKVVNADHVSIHDFSIDMVRPPYSYGYVVAEPASNALRIAFDTLPAVDTGMLIAAITEYDVTQVPLAQGLDDYYLDDTSMFSITQTAPQILNVTMTARSTPGAQTGEYVMVRHAFREQPAFLALNSNYVSIGNVNVYAAPGDGIQSNMVNTLYVQNLNLRNATGRHMSVTGHGIEAHGTTGGVTICGSTLEGMGGDGINTTGQPGSVTAVAGKTITVSTSAAYGVAPFRVGDEIRVYGPTGGVRGGAIVNASSVISDAATSNTLAFQYVPYGTHVGDAVIAYNRDANINIRYNAIAHNSGRGIALANGRVVVDHTQVQGSTGYGLQCYADLQTTGPACDRVALTNNNFHAVGNSNNLASASFRTDCGNALCPNKLTQNISLVSNGFDNTAGRAVEFASVYAITMQKNALNRIAAGQPMNSTSAVDIVSGTLGVISGNTVANSSVLAVSQSNDTNVTISNNTGTW